MSDDIVIRAEGLGKKYIIGHEAERERYVALRDVMTRMGRNAWRKASDLFRGRDIVAGDEVEEFWALKDVSFEVKRGEVLGIIGRNGAGKSTLLKVLSRITEPSEGRVTIKGRVASLLEVGTGFHPELTGRENIYLNGAVLGMTRAEIKRKFDEIVAFAEVEKFLDTPVKRYSSGMYVRLAFAVAAHLEPEILIVDEVLAVGDAEFQKKCLGKLREVSTGAGRTVLFVTHNINAIRSLCTKGVFLSYGRSQKIGSVDECISEYLYSTTGGFQKIPRTVKRPEIVAIDLDNRALFSGSLRLTIQVVSPHELEPPILGLVIYDLFGVPVFGSNAESHPDDSLSGPMSEGKVVFEAASIPLQTGSYSISFFLGDRKQHYVTLEHAVNFQFVNPRPPQKQLAIDSNGSLNWPASWTRLEKDAYEQE
jgi:lipopolysaccharide transport system ATP-binding protein